MKPLCIDLFSGLGGWSEGFIAEGYECIGFDIERHRYSRPKVIVEQSEVCGEIAHTTRFEENWIEYPGQLVIQDVLTLHGSQFRNAAVIVASPPCQNYSYLAMPWSRSTNPENSKAAKALRKKWETEGPDNRLFDACFRIQREAIAATGETCPNCYGSGVWEMRIAYSDKIDKECPNCNGIGAINTRFIPLIVENVRGAIPWVGRSAWNYGSFHLWGDVPALMPVNLKRGQKVPGFRFDGSGGSFQTAAVEHTGVKENPDGTNRPLGSWFRITSPHENENGTKIGGDWFSDPKSTCRKHGSRSQARKAASAQIAKIPLPLSQHIAQVYKPREYGMMATRQAQVEIRAENK